MAVARLNNLQRSQDSKTRTVPPPPSFPPAACACLACHSTRLSPARRTCAPNCKPAGRIHGTARSPRRSPSLPFHAVPDDLQPLFQRRRTPLSHIDPTPYPVPGVHPPGTIKALGEFGDSPGLAKAFFLLSLLRIALIQTATFRPFRKVAA
jgi:hypothetical protein